VAIAVITPGKKCTMRLAAALLESAPPERSCSKIQSNFRGRQVCCSLCSPRHAPEASTELSSVVLAPPLQSPLHLPFPLPLKSIPSMEKFQEPAPFIMPSAGMAVMASQASAWHCDHMPFQSKGLQRKE